ncbi:hypothetical protein B0H67DRAFT_548234 [Lasiosphaeris hirsuta]|uniref:Uncharacterized protein n=1 Tax=Lasiosphaeris hirsuta TaxID=260670 RepID=A0AA40B9Q9_9PEZI|nr:hypothetical protein B0H67DRAFT_548234 [Lasiosphaeris hirsuta]
MAELSISQQRTDRERRLSSQPDEDRTHRSVPCKVCVAAILQYGPNRETRRMADKYRDGRVACTDKSNVLEDQRAGNPGEHTYCIECRVAHGVCEAIVDTSVTNLAVKLQEAYTAAFGKSEESVEYLLFQDAVKLCYKDGEKDIKHLKEGLRRKKKGRQPAKKSRTTAAAAAAVNDTNEGFHDAEIGVNDNHAGVSGGTGATASGSTPRDNYDSDDDAETAETPQTATLLMDAIDPAREYGHRD